MHDGDEFFDRSMSDRGELEYLIVLYDYRSKKLITMEKI